MSKIPDSMDELVYFSRRTIAGNIGPVVAWVKKTTCPKCKTLMGKPVEKGKVLVRADEYRCPKCGFSEGKQAHETKLTATVQYACPFCGHKGETTAPYARKSWYGKKAVVFQCEGCKERLGITKKLSIPPMFLAKLEGKNVKETEAVEEDDF